MYQQSTADKFIVFKIADYLLALPISDVLKVVNCSPATSSRLRTMGVIQLGRHMIRVVDLHQQLSSGNLSQLPGDQPFLVIIRTPEAELCGIPVEEPPNLVEIPSEVMQSLPKSDRYGKPTLDLVSHAAVLSQGEVTTTIFLLDLNWLLNSAPNNSPLLPTVHS